MSLERARRRRAPTLALGIALGMALAAAVAGPVVAANNVVVLAYFGDCQFGGSNAGAGKTVKIDWRDSDGNLKSKHSVISTSGGAFVSKCELGEFVETGDVLKTTIGTAARSFTVPKLTLTANRQLDTVFGFYDPSPASLVVQAITYKGGFALSTASVHTAVPSLCCPTMYQADNWDTAPNLKGWDEVYTEWSNARGDSVVRYRIVGGIRVWVRQPFVDFVGNPNDVIQVTVVAGSVFIDTITARLDQDGRFYGTLVNPSIDPVRIRAGYSVTNNVEVDFAFPVPAITATIDKAANKVTASCGLGTNVGIRVDARTRDLSRIQSRAGFTNGSGVLVANFATSPTYDIVTGDKVDVYCKLPPGDVVAKTFTVS